MADRILDAVLRSSRIQIRRGTASAWASINPVLRDGEPGYEEDTERFKLGDGETPWADLAYQDGKWTTTDLGDIDGDLTADLEGSSNVAFSGVLLDDSTITIEGLTPGCHFELWPVRGPLEEHLEATLHVSGGDLEDSVEITLSAGVNEPTRIGGYSPDGTALWLDLSAVSGSDGGSGGIETVITAVDPDTFGTGVEGSATAPPAIEVRGDELRVIGRVSIPDSSEDVWGGAERIMMLPLAATPSDREVVAGQGPFGIVAVNIGGASTSVGVYTTLTEDGVEIWFDGVVPEFPFPGSIGSVYFGSLNWSIDGSGDGSSGVDSSVATVTPITTFGIGGSALSGEGRDTVYEIRGDMLRLAGMVHVDPSAANFHDNYEAFLFLPIECIPAELADFVADVANAGAGPWQWANLALANLAGPPDSYKVYVQWARFAGGIGVYFDDAVYGDAGLLTPFDMSLEGLAWRIVPPA